MSQKTQKIDETVISELLAYAQRGGGSRSGGGASERVTERVSERQARLGPGGSGDGSAKETGGVDPQTSLPGAASSRKMMTLILRLQDQMYADDSEFPCTDTVMS